MDMEQKRRTHKFFDKHTILGMIVLILIGLFGTQGLGELIGTPIKSLTGNEYFGSGIGIAVITFVILALYKYWFRPDFEGMLRGGDPRFIRQICIVMIVYWILDVPLVFIGGFGTFGPPSLTSIGISIMAGCSEELAFRGLPLSYLMRQWKDEKRILVSVVITSVIFGAIHMSNAVVGADLGSSIIQVFSSIAMGIFLAAVYLRTGNLLVTMILHFMHDILALLDVKGIQDGVVTASVNWTSYCDLGITIGLAIVGFWLIRSAKHSEIRALWDKKWNM